MVRPTTTTQPGWQRLSNMPTPRSEVPVVTLDGKIYAAGGYTAGIGIPVHGQAVVEVYDPPTGEWTRIADLPAARHHPMAAAAAGRVFVFGGYDANTDQPTATAWSYDPATDRWSDVAPMPGPVAAGAAVAAGDQIFVVGGVPAGTSLFRYDPDTNTWTEHAPMPRPSEHLAGALYEGNLYAIGGRWGGDELTKVDVYDIAADSWAAATPLQEARGGFGAVALGDRIIAVGGEVAAAGDALDSVEVLDPQVGSWSFALRLPVPIHGHGVVVVDGRLYVVGGSRVGADVVNFGDVFVGSP
jgi:N-acetylneuraminic acid mutarotase